MDQDQYDKVRRIIDRLALEHEKILTEGGAANSQPVDFHRGRHKPALKLLGKTCSNRDLQSLNIGVPDKDDPPDSMRPRVPILHMLRVPALTIDGKGCLYFVFHSPDARLLRNIADQAVYICIARNITGKEYQAEYHQLTESKKQHNTGKQKSHIAKQSLGPGHPDVLSFCSSTWLVGSIIVPVPGLPLFDQSNLLKCATEIVLYPQRIM